VKAGTSLPCNCTLHIKAIVFLICSSVIICKLNYKAVVVNAQVLSTVTLHLVQSGDFSITQLPISVTSVSHHVTANLDKGFAFQIPTLPLFNTFINNVPHVLDHQSILAFESFVIAKYQVLSNIKADHQLPVISQADLPAEFHNDILGVILDHQLLNLKVLFDETICKIAVGLVVHIPTLPLSVTLSNSVPALF
jgi:hypothetical protein